MEQDKSRIPLKLYLSASKTRTPSKPWAHQMPTSWYQWLLLYQLQLCSSHSWGIQIVTIKQLLLLSDSTQSTPKPLVFEFSPKSPNINSHPAMAPCLWMASSLLTKCSFLSCNKWLNQLCSTTMYSWWSLARGHWEAHLTDKKTEAQKGKVTRLRSHRILGYDQWSAIWPHIRFSGAGTQLFICVKSFPQPRGYDAEWNNSRQWKT